MLLNLNTRLTQKFSCPGINNALMGVEVPRLVERLRETYKNEENQPLTRRTGWKLLWDVRRSKVVITEADGSTWEQKVGEVPPNVQGLFSSPTLPTLELQLEQLEMLILIPCQKLLCMVSRLGSSPSFRPSSRDANTMNWT